VAEIKLNNDGFAYIEIGMKPFEGFIQKKVEFKLDTGANISTISKEDLRQKLGYTEAWITANTIEDSRLCVNSASMPSERAYYVAIPICNVLNKKLMNWPFYIRPIGEVVTASDGKEIDRDYNNLLGLNIFSYFNFEFSYSTGMLKINSIQKPYIKFSMISNQSIHEVTI